MTPDISPETLRELAALDTCAVANAIESFKVRLFNEGFNGPGISCRTTNLPPMAGFAVTLRMRSAEPPMKSGFYLNQTDWYHRLDDSDTPRVLVIQDIDKQPGRGALAGGVHASILKGLGFTGLVTNGALRGIPQFNVLNLHAFSGNLSVSHSYGHLVEFGGPVEIAGVTIRPGDLIHGDQHGFIQIPVEIAARVPAAAMQFQKLEMEISDYAQARGFTMEGLQRLVGRHQ